METPKVFASYSHDSDEHKQWVLQLCTKLVENGIDVNLDQWDLGAGDDITLFMEKGVRDSARVLVICTDTYVRKANAGEGGVGYERLIVTAQLAQDLGTKKFIPIIRQSSTDEKTPIFLATRLYIDFTDDGKFDESFKKLLHEIHNVPIIQKPRLGRNPLSDHPSEPEISSHNLPEIPEKVESPSDAYKVAFEFARADDILGWRQFVKQVCRNASNCLGEWKPKFEQQERDSTEKILETIDKAVDIVSPLISVALAGVESQKKDFNDQKSVLRDLFTITEWKDSTYSTWMDMPNVLRYVYHSLHGGLGLNTDQLNLALSLVRENARVAYPGDSQGRVWEVPELIGRYYFNAGARDLWEHLITAYKRWKWLDLIFRDEEEYRASLVAYYMALNIHELAAKIASGEESKLDSHYFSVPLDFLSEKYERKEHAVDILLHNSTLPELWECLGITHEQMRISWKIWIDQCKQRFRNAYQGYFQNGGVHPNHESFFDNL